MATSPARSPHPQTLSGRYHGAGAHFSVRLRIDVDGQSPVGRVSADYVNVSDGSPVGSMRVDEPVITAGPRETTITGAARFSFPARCDRVKITIPRAPPGAPTPSAVRLRHLTPAGAAGASGGLGAAYDCAFTSASFRVVELEQACETGVAVPGEYDTSALSSRCAPRRLSPVQAFAEAGIELRPVGPPTTIDTSAAGENATWSDAELQAAMQEHFTRWVNRPRWAIWLLHAALHDDDRLAGIMFDQAGRYQRQGCAVFYGHERDEQPERLRYELHTCVHELGHAFSLPHSWQQSLTDPPLPGRPDALSWMNYPERFSAGASAYWDEFAFGFDQSELVYLRHAFEYDVIMGGKPFRDRDRGRGRGRVRGRRAPDWDVDLRHDDGLRLKLSAPAELAQDVPVTAQLELTATTAQGRVVPPVLGTRPGNVGIAIRRPDGTDFMFEPLLYHCRGHETVVLRAGDPPLRDAAFIHYGRRGFAFDRPGRYELRALFAQPDGRVVVSDVVSIRIRPPVSRVDRHISELIGGDEQVGKLMSLMGSDAPALARGDERLKRIVARYPEHPVGLVARLARAANLAHGFKRVTPDGVMRPREPRLHAAAELAADVVQRPSARRTGGRARMRPGADPAVIGFFNSRIREISASAARYADA
jgi:hypothetical protein